ncbi:hypothetical protein [Nesterenkonia ebinurensis]|uniref:hypothetical protein n=1 Tax=Nesterenkonia ebinurensis TaxID=2608252 RepID=UPI00168BD0FE|nr:hypothetical protein [Nesterenkonia ebinurensis]
MVWTTLRSTPTGGFCFFLIQGAAVALTALVPPWASTAAGVGAGTLAGDVVA